MENATTAESCPRVQRVSVHGHLARFPWSVNTNAGASGIGTTDST